MENFPANLDDGELWLPSDILPSLDHKSHHRHRDDQLHHDQVHHHRLISSGDDLVRQFNHLNVRDQHRITTPPTVPSLSHSQRFGPMEQYALTPCPPNGSYGLTVGPPQVDRGLRNYGTGPRPRLRPRPGPIYPAPEPVPRNPMHKPVRPLSQPVIADQRCGSMETRIGRGSTINRLVLEDHKNRPQNRLLPFQPNRYWFGSSKKDCRGSTTAGTGVFIPRATVTPTIHGGTETILGVTAYKSSTKKLSVNKAAEYYSRHQGPPDLSLPKDWTY